MRTVKDLQTVSSNVKSVAEAAMSDGGGLLRLAPCWVPRSFLQPGKRLKLDPKDLYAFGLNRGGIDERWFGSTTPAANENRTPDRSEEHTSELQSRQYLVCRLLLEKTHWTSHGTRSRRHVF